jgi:hypothetical protein
MLKRDRLLLKPEAPAKDPTRRFGLGPSLALQALMPDVAVVSEPSSESSLAERPPAASFATTARPDSMFHWLLLVVAVGVLCAASVLRVEGGDRVVLPVINQALPGVCTYKLWFGVSCPGCGLTRCFISLAHGEVLAAFRFNPAGILLFAFAVVQVPFRSLQIWRIRRGAKEIRLRRLSAWVFWGLLVALLGQWLVRTLIFGISA